MKILVTGAAGFIGSNFVLYMMDKYKDAEIVVVDNKVIHINQRMNDDELIDSVLARTSSKVEK